MSIVYIANPRDYPWRLPSINKICNRYNLKSFAKCIQLTGHRLDRNKILPVDSLDVTTTA